MIWLRRCAFGFSAAFSWLFQDTCAIARFTSSIGETVARRVGRAELRERARRREARMPEVFERALGALGQAAEARVLEFFDAHRERDVDRAGGNRIRRAAQRLGARCAEILDARHRHVRQAQRHRQRQPRLAHALLLVEHAEPRGLDAVALDARVRRASVNASTMRSSGPLSQRSPNFEHPMPTIATLSRMPVATISSSPAWLSRNSGGTRAPCRSP